MGIIKALKLGFDYFKYDDDGNIQETQRAVDQVSVDIQEGEFVAVLGHNGSGKSTFAKQLDAILLPQHTATILPTSFPEDRSRELPLRE